ncbi:MAG: hypothetical protein NTY32_02215, partial [Bacteroidia bacterium]|nr:hypothetical protein [Bacteroidia bacterium]
FSDLKFHSVVEKKAFTNFAQKQSDTLNAFLAIDEMLTSEDAVYLKNKFEVLYKELKAKKIETKKVNAQIKLVYSTIKNNCLKAYIEEEILSSTLLYGRFNEATASILLALIFDRLHIPYQILDSSEEFFMIANPGPNEQKLEVGNPIHVYIEHTPDFKKQYVDFMRRSGKISEAEMRTHTFTELFDEKSREKKQLSLNELLGMLYYFQSARKLQLEDVHGSLALVQKGFYLYQTPYVQMHYLRCLAKKMEQFTVEKASDIDYLVQLYRVGNLDVNTTTDIFKNILANQLEYTDRAGLCDSLYERFIRKVSDQELIDNVCFAYNLLRVNQKNPTYSDIFRIDKAVCILPNRKDINDFLEGVILMNLFKIRDEHSRMDSIRSLTNQLKSPLAKELLKTQRMTLLLEMAQTAYKSNKTKEGDKLLLEFEATCPRPIGNEFLRMNVEQTYREIATT